MRFLAIDYGTKRIGLAISDGVIATPLGVIINQKDPLAVISSVCERNAVDKIIIGLPGQSAMAKQIKKFGQQLELRVNKPVVFWDETLTTVEANKFGKPEKSDAIAAALILQSYLDNETR